MTGLLELAERCEQATEPDRVLDWDIALSAYGARRALREDQVPRFTATALHRKITAKTLREFAALRERAAE